jgi:hypothetical protein
LFERDESFTQIKKIETYAIGLRTTFHAAAANKARLKAGLNL